MTKVAPLAESDFDEWLPLWHGYRTFYRATVQAETTKLTFARLTERVEPMGGFVARDASPAVVGITHWIIHRSCWTIGDYCYLQDLFVSNGHRGKGIGPRLIETVYSVAMSRECSRVYRRWHETNLEAMGLYNLMADRSGFVQCVKRLT